jgi:hypothetical protein
LLFDFRGGLAWASGDVGGGVEMAAVRPSVDLELDDLFVGVHEVFVLVLILKTILERVLPDISSVLNLLVDLIE